MASPAKERILHAAEQLRRAPAGGRRALIGFDGFVDEIADVVRTRYSPDRYERIETIAEFAERIAGAAGLSTNIEYVPTQIKIGGNGPIMANALAALGIDVLYVGSVGDGEVHPVFRGFASACRVVPVAVPGHTIACEFRDGKVMLGRTQSLAAVTWERILASLPLERLREELLGCSLFAAVNWTMLPHMTEVWHGILTQALTPPPPEPGPLAFFDLADPAKRSRAELLEAVRAIVSFGKVARPILGLNRKEATEVADALGLEVQGDNRTASLAAITQALGEALDVYAVVVHPTQEAAVYSSVGLSVIEGPYTSRPRLTTGAGDNFNAGFCLGQVLGMDPEASLILGKGVSGFYVRNGRSPSRDELIEFLTLWAERCGEEF